MKTQFFKYLVAVPVGLALMTLSARAASFLGGDVFAAVGNGGVQQWRSVAGTLTLVDTLNTGQGGFTTGMAFDSSGRLYVTNFSSGSIARFNNNGTLDTGTFVTGINSAPESIVFDAVGNFYVGSASGAKDILKYSSTGSLLSTYNVAIEVVGADWIDLAADGKTMFYTSEGTTVKRFDVSTNTQLTDFATGLSGANAFALRLLGDGGLLVADRADIKRLDSTGAVIQTYDTGTNNNWFGLNLDPDGTSFWSGDFGTGQFHKFNIASGALLDSASTGSSNHYGLTVFGEQTAAVPTPEGGCTLLYALLALSAMAGVNFRIRKVA